MNISVFIKNDRTVICDKTIIANENENKATVLTISFENDVSNKDVYLEFEKANKEKFVSKRLEIEVVKSIVENLELTSIYGYFEMPNTLLDVKGDLLMQVVVRDNENVVYKSNIYKFYVGKSINAVDEIEESNPDLISDIQKQIDEVENKTKILDVSGNGNKFLANDGKYKEVSGGSGGTGIEVLTGTTEAPIILRDLEAGVYILDGKVTPYKGATSTTYSNNFATVQKTSTYTFIQVMYAQSNNIQYYKIHNTNDVFEKTTTSLDDLQEKSTIAKNTNSTTVTTQLSNNLFYQCLNDLTQLTIKFPTTIEDDYKSRITFKSGATPTKIICEHEVQWFGYDVSNSEFTLQPNTTYHIEFYQTIYGMTAYVRINEPLYNYIVLIDQTTKKEYKLYVNNEELRIMEVV